MAQTIDNQSLFQCFEIHINHYQLRLGVIIIFFLCTVWHKLQANKGTKHAADDCNGENVSVRKTSKKKSNALGFA